jgi:hypothetical protein
MLLKQFGSCGPGLARYTTNEIVEYFFERQLAGSFVEALSFFRGQ